MITFGSSSIAFTSPLRELRRRVIVHCWATVVINQYKRPFLISPVRPRPSGAVPAQKILKKKVLTWDMHLSAPALEGGTVKQGRALPLNACMSIPPGRSTSPHSLVLSTSDLHLHMGPRTTGCGNIVSSRYLSFICLQGFFIFPAIYFADVRKDYLRPLGKTKMSPT